MQHLQYHDQPSRHHRAVPRRQQVRRGTCADAGRLGAWHWHKSGCFAQSFYMLGERRHDATASRGDDVGLNRHYHATLGPNAHCLTMTYEITANTGRCEALTVSDIPVYRCTSVATADRDGHAVCAAHSRALRISYYDGDDSGVLHG